MFCKILNTPAGANCKGVMIPPGVFKALQKNDLSKNLLSKENQKSKRKLSFEEVSS